MSKKNKQQITEEMKVHKQWYIDATSQTPTTLPKFLRHLMNDYEHDYGTTVHAVTAGAVATARVMGHKFGITGFQAGCIMWGFMEKFNHIEFPARLIRFENMLYPQFQREFEKTITEDTWKYLQKEAKRKLKTTEGEVHPEVLKHWKSIVNGKIPFGYTIREE